MFLLLLGIALGACSRTFSEDEKRAIAQAYGETLIVRNIYKTDSVQMLKSVDSIARAFGFTDERELLATITELAEQPDELHKMFDTTERYLQRVQANEEKGDTATPAPNDSTRTTGADTTKKQQ